MSQQVLFVPGQSAQYSSVKLLYPYTAVQMS